jgi:hypothetical protein
MERDRRGEAVWVPASDIKYRGDIMIGKSHFRKLMLVLAGALATQVSGQHNTLTPDEQSAGYQLLFNGSNLSTGWRSWNSTTPPNGWVAAPESSWKIIQLKNPINQAGSLVTSDATFQNFDLKIEWNVPSAGNSGIFIRYNQFNKDLWGGSAGPEAQIAAINNNDGTAPLHRAGTCYDMFPLDERALGWDMFGGGTNYNKYQQFRIIAFNGHIAHFGNGIKLVEYVMHSEKWKTAYTNSKYATFPQYAVVHPGSIMIQDHGEGDIKFRDIRIKKLTQNPWGLGSPYLINANDTTKGLKDLTFADNLFPTTSSARFFAQEGQSRFAAGPHGLSLMLDRGRNYTIGIRDLQGRTISMQAVEGIDRFVLHNGIAPGGRFLEVHSGSKTIYNGFISLP